MKNLVLNTEEYAWLHHEVSRLWASQQKLAEEKPSMRKTPLFAIYGELAKIFQDPITQHEIRILALNRKKARMVEHLVSSQIKVLDEKIIPGYEEKILKGEPKERIEPYIARAKALTEILKKIHTKVEELL
jgi:hypothetical protein